MTELIEDGVIERETYIWKTGMADWTHAFNSMELRTAFSTQAPNIPPPPPFLPSKAGPAHSPILASPSLRLAYSESNLPLSDKSRVIAGVLQLLIPGVGRMYLGYAAIGILQLFLTPFGCMIGWIWSVIDGFMILAGSIKLDGYGRRLTS